MKAMPTGSLSLASGKRGLEFATVATYSCGADVSINSKFLISGDFVGRTCADPETFHGRFACVAEISRTRVELNSW